MIRRIHIVLLLLVSLGLSAQKTLIPSVSNYHLTWTTLNPAFTGYRDAASLSSLYRSPLYGGTGPMDMQLNGHTPVGNSKVGLGAVVAYNNSPPDDGLYCLMTTYAYRLYLGTGRLAFGLSAGLYGVRSDIGNISLANPTGDLSFPEEVYSRWFPNFGAGVLYYTEKLYLGVSVPELLAVPGPGQSLGANMEDYRIIGIGAYRFDFGNSFQLKPSVMVDYTRASWSFTGSVNLGLWKKVFLGAAYAHPQYIIALVNYQVTNKWLVGYAYTMGVGPVQKALGGSHEVVLRWEFRPTVKTIPDDPFYF